MTDEELRQLLGLVSPALAFAGGAGLGDTGLVGLARSSAEGGFGGMGLASILGGNGPFGGGGGLTIPGAGATSSPAVVMPNAGMPATPPTVAPPGPMSLGPPAAPPVPPPAMPPPGGVMPPLPMAPGGPAGPVPDPVNPGAAGVNPGPGWLQRNVGSPLSEMWNGKPKLDQFGNPMIGPDGKPILDTTGQLTDRQKALIGTANAVGGAASKAGATPAAALAARPAAAAGAYRPGPVNATALSQARLQQLALLRQQATLAAPWLRRYQQPGLMG